MGRPRSRQQCSVVGCLALHSAKGFCKAHYSQNYNENHLLACAARNHASKQRRRNAVLVLLGDVCKRCGFSDKRALQIDHIWGGGRQEYKRLYDCYTMCAKILKMDKPEDEYQILCANCNWIKRCENGEIGGNRNHV